MPAEPLHSGDALPAPTPPTPQPRPLRIPLTVMESHDCVYLPGRTAQMQATWAPSTRTGTEGNGNSRAGMDPVVFEALLNAGFRRSGNVVYRPVCPGCRACRPLRIDVSAFKPSASQRRVLRANADLSISIGRPDLTPEKSDLYARYLAGQHERVPSTPEDNTESPLERLREFLYNSPVTTLEMTYRAPDGALLAVGICDLTPTILSSVYFYWDPDHRKRSLGILGALWEIETARRNGQRFYHLGYWVENAPTMHYKAQLADHELLQDDGSWQSAIRHLGYL